MPSAKKYHINEIINASCQYFESTSRRIIFEYTLINGFNDSYDDIVKLSRLLKGIPCHINLIPLNNFNFMKSPSLRDVHAFAINLGKEGLSVTVRKSMGSSVEGACGQLKLSFNANI